MDGRYLTVILLGLGGRGRLHALPRGLVERLVVDAAGVGDHAASELGRGRPLSSCVDDVLGLAHPAATQGHRSQCRAGLESFPHLLTSSSGASATARSGSGSRRSHHRPPSTRSARDERIPDTLLRDDRRLDLGSRPGKVAGSDLACRCQIATEGQSRPGGSAGDSHRDRWPSRPRCRCYRVQPEECHGDRLGRAAGRRGADGAAGLRALLAAAGGGRRPDRRRPDQSPAATWRTRPTGSPCAPNAGWSPRCTRPAAAPWPR